MLEEALRNEVLRRLHPMILNEIEKIVSELNSLGHDLRLRQTAVPGDIHYRDWRPQSCDLMLGCDTIISATFRKAIEP